MTPQKPHPQAQPKTMTNRNLLLKALAITCLNLIAVTTPLSLPAVRAQENKSEKVTIELIQLIASAMK
jgi:hypothetical protein